MKTKLVPCPNITKREINNALMNGRKFCINSDRVKHLEIHWDDNHGNSPVRQGLERWDWRGFKHLCELVEQHWYEDPDMIGKPVKVRDCQEDEWVFEVYTGYRKGHDFQYATNSNIRMYCEPLTSADLYQGEV